MRNAGFGARTAVLLATAAALLTVWTAPAMSAEPASVMATADPCKSGRQSVFRITGWLHTCGTVILDRNGRKARLRSFELNSLAAGAGDRAPTKCGHWSLPSSRYYWKVPQWGFNSVSLLVSWANLEPVRPSVRSDGTTVHHWNREYLEAIDEVVRQFHRHDVAVVLTMVQSRWSPAFRNLVLPNGRVQTCGIGMPQWLYPHGGGIRDMVRAELRFFRNRNHIQRRFLAAWGKLASRYRTNQAVVGAVTLFEQYDLLAQPYPETEGLGPSDLGLARFDERVGARIHRSNPHLLVVIKDWRSRDATPWFALTRRPRVPRGVYAFEFYEANWYPDGLNRASVYTKRGHGWHMPVWIAEFTAFNYTRRADPDIPVDPNWQQDTRLLLAWARKHQVGWALAGTPDYKLAALLRDG